MKKLFLGIAAMIAVQAAGTLIFDVSGISESGSPTVGAWLLNFLAAVVGAYVARRPFYVAATAYWVVVWALIFWTLYSVAAPVAPVSWTSMLHTNRWLLFASASALLAGAAVVHISRARFPASRRPAV